MADVDKLTPGQVAYEGYRMRLGCDAPLWDHQSAITRDAWEAAALEVLKTERALRNPPKWRDCSQPSCPVDVCLEHEHHACHICRDLERVLTNLDWVGDA